MRFRSLSESDTDEFAARLAEALRPGDVVALHGPLGAGKTRFVRGLVSALGGDTRLVSSPTFVLLNIYHCPRVTLYHLDAYRVRGAEDLEAIGFSELLAPAGLGASSGLSPGMPGMPQGMPPGRVSEEAGIVLIEWPSRVPELIPSTALHVHLDPVDENTRHITVHRGPMAFPPPLGTGAAAPAPGGGTI